jgi:membrane protease subunit HflC
MKKALIPAAVVLVLAAIVLYASLYTVQEGKQAVITQFGRPVAFVQDAGLQFKIPFIQTVHVLEKRLLPWDGDAENMQTRDKKRIFIDVWARWRIAEPVEFFEAVRTEGMGQKILDDLVDAAVRDVVAQNNLIDVVRSTNEKLVYESEEMRELTRSGEVQQDLVTTGRAKMEERILEVVSDDLEKNNYGMELRDFHVKRINYIESVKVTVYERMRSERLRIANLFESEAEKEKNRILGLTRKELDQIEGEMKQKSAEIRGAADAEVIRLTADAYGRSPEFFQFLRRLEVFKKTLGQDTRLIMSTRSDLFQLLKETDAILPVANQ